jgi:hypothetical protein
MIRPSTRFLASLALSVGLALSTLPAAGDEEGAAG